MSFRSYRIYQLNISSEIAFPGLPRGMGPAEVVIRRARLEAPTSPEEAERRGIRTTATQANLFVPGYGAVSVRGGGEILADPLPEVGEQAVRLLVLEYAMAILLHQRGLLVLHASAVHNGRSATVFVGDQGWGKSTMAAALYEHGLRVATDDIAAIELPDSAPARLWPTFPQLKLWPKSLVSLAKDPLSLPPVLPHMDKRIQRLKGGPPRKPIVLGRIYVLGKADALAAERLDHQEAFAHLVRHQYSTLAELVKLSGSAADNVSRIARVVEQVPVFLLVRPPSLDRITELAGWVKRHIENATGTEQATSA